MDGIVKSITVATSELVNAAASATSHPDDRATQQNLVRVGHALGGNLNLTPCLSCLLGEGNYLRYTRVR